MAKNKKSTIYFEDGQNAESVTGSLIYIETEHHKILLEAGLYQSNDVFADYKINSRKFQTFKPKEIDYIFLAHVHADHSLLIPRLYAEGCEATIIAPKGTKELFQIMALDSNYILQKDIDWLRKKYERKYAYLYEEGDIFKAISHFDEYDYKEKIMLDQYLSFEFIPSGHIINAAQLKLWICEHNTVKTILYTSDLGNLELPKYYAKPFEPVDKANIVIAESTYGDSERRNITQKDREKDIEKILTVVEQVQHTKGRVMIPIFSLDRCQNMLTILYNLFSEMPDFNMPILIDSPLAIKISKAYLNLLNEEDAKEWQRILTWKNVKLIHEYTDSRLWQDSGQQCIVLTASGFLVRGRSREWTKTILTEANSHLLFCGFASENSLAGKIKRSTRNKTLTIDNKPYRIKCNITDLKSFSSHIQRDQMIEYYSNINCDKVALVHGEFKGKCSLSEDLQKRIREKNKTSKVVVVNSSTHINF